MIVENLSYECDHLGCRHVRGWQHQNSLETAKGEVDTVRLVRVYIRVEQGNDKHQHQHHDDDLLQCDISQQLSYLTLLLVHLLQNLCIQQFIHLLFRQLSLKTPLFNQVL